MRYRRLAYIVVELSMHERRLLLLRCLLTELHNILYTTTTYLPTYPAGYISFLCVAVISSLIMFFFQNAFMGAFFFGRLYSWARPNKRPHRLPKTVCLFFFVCFLVIDSINTFLHSLVEAKHPACKDESFDDTFDLAAVFFL